MVIVRKIINRLRKLWASFQLWRQPRYHSIFIEGDLPNSLEDKAIYIVQEDGFLWHASMLCPCGCGEVIHLNLIPDERPCWQLSKNQDDTISLFPSVWRTKGCQSHFWFRHNKVHWHREISPY